MVTPVARRPEGAQRYGTTVSMPRNPDLPDLGNRPGRPATHETACIPLKNLNRAHERRGEGRGRRNICVFSAALSVPREAPEKAAQQALPPACIFRNGS